MYLEDMRHPDPTYQLLRNLTSPIVAVTARRGGKENGMILDSAVRASIVPSIPRLSVYIHKFNYSHDMVFETGRFAAHLLEVSQFDVVRRLGFASGREQDKLMGIPHHTGKIGLPILDECFAHFECEVANVMDTGSSTCFLADVVAFGLGKRPGLEPHGELMTATYFRNTMPAEWRQEYLLKLEEAQAFAAAKSRDIKPVVWKRS
jgi:flavin reductase (DIM6/NTAB) family NADH-FMN oxidoreductase RutF